MTHNHDTTLSVFFDASLYLLLCFDPAILQALWLQQLPEPRHVFVSANTRCVYCWMVSLMTMNVHVSTWCSCISPRGRAPPKKPYRYLERFPDRNCCNSMIKMIITEIIQQYAEISVSRTWIFSVELAFRVIGAMPTRMFAYIWAFQILDLPGGRTDGQATALFWKKLKNSCYSGYL